MAYINTVAVKAIREELKARFPKYKFSVRKSSCHSSVYVSLMKGPASMMELVKNDSMGYVQINQYHLDMYGKHEPFFKKVLRIIKNAEGGETWYDNSDSMIDYFDTAFYINMSVGQFGKDYQIA